MVDFDAVFDYFVYSLVISWLLLMPSRVAISFNAFQDRFSSQIEITAPCRRIERALRSYRLFAPFAAC